MIFLSTPLGMIMTFAFVMVALYLLYGLLDPTFGNSSAVQKRLNQRVLKKPSSKNQQKKMSAIDITGMKPKGLFETIVTRIMPRPDKLRDRLARTGKKITIGNYILMNIAAIGIVGFLCYFNFGASATTSVGLAICIGMMIPHKYINRLIDKRSRAFMAFFPDAIDLVVRGVRSGLPIGESIKSIAKEMPEPLKTEFGIVNDSMKLGQTVEKALWECSDRLNIQEVKFFVIALSIQRETGGNLAETLDNLSNILRKRRYMQMKIKAMSSEARASAMIIGSLPFIMFGVLMLMNRPYVSALLTDPRGHTMLGVGLFLIFLGNAIMRKMAKFKI